MLPREGHLLRIFVGEKDKRDGIPLYEWLVKQARERKMAGATVLRGLQGFGAKSHIHKTQILRLASDLPIVIEIVDTKDKIEAFMPIVDEAITDGLANLEKVDIRFYRARKEGDSSG